jgi:hypothetical protein
MRGGEVDLSPLFEVERMIFLMRSTFGQWMDGIPEGSLSEGHSTPTGLMDALRTDLERALLGHLREIERKLFNGKRPKSENDRIILRKIFIEKRRSVKNIINSFVDSVSGNMGKKNVVANAFNDIFTDLMG